jgi:hypothetical protein
MMEAVSTSETSVNFYQTTRRNIPEDRHLPSRRREKLKPYLISCILFIYGLFNDAVNKIRFNIVDSSTKHMLAMGRKVFYVVRLS